MTEHVFGLSVNEVIAYAAIANVVVVLLLAAITTTMRHAKRQADVATKSGRFRDKLISRSKRLTSY
jgi:hypothetical protein